MSDDSTDAEDTLTIGQAHGFKMKLVRKDSSEPVLTGTKAIMIFSSAENLVWSDDVITDLAIDGSYVSFANTPELRDADLPTVTEANLVFALFDHLPVQEEVDLLRSWERSGMVDATVIPNDVVCMWVPNSNPPPGYVLDCVVISTVSQLGFADDEPAAPLDGTGSVWQVNPNPPPPYILVGGPTGPSDGALEPESEALTQGGEHARGTPIGGTPPRVTNAIPVIINC